MTVFLTVICYDGIGNKKKRFILVYLFNIDNKNAQQSFAHSG